MEPILERRQALIIRLSLLEDEAQANKNKILLLQQRQLDNQQEQRLIKEELKGFDVGDGK
jgi:hypothetical protein